MNHSPVQIYLIPSILAPETQQQVIAPATRDIIGLLDYFLVENIRTARRFISSLGIKDVSNIHFEVFNKNSKPEELETLLAPISQGISVGVLSEAGCPGVADPGNHIVMWAHRNNVKVTPLAGPSSILLGLMASGLNGQYFEFHGYLPIDESMRIKKIRALENESAKTGKTQIFMETPYRNQALARSLVQNCHGDSWLCIACNLTDPNEYIKTRRVREWKKDLPDLHKKPVIFLLYVGSTDN